MKQAKILEATNWLELIGFEKDNFEVYRYSTGPIFIEVQIPNEYYNYYTVYIYGDGDEFCNASIETFAELKFVLNTQLEESKKIISE